MVADINWAKRNGIRLGPSRGSSAAHAYDAPLPLLDHDLDAERFLQPDRVSMPDRCSFDVRRGEVIYVTEKAAVKRRSHGCHLRHRGQTDIKDASRVMDLPYSVETPHR